MTYEEALKELQILKGDMYDSYICKALEMGIEALEKQIPKKPILKNGKASMHINCGDKPHEIRITKWQDWVCPVCGWFVGQRYNRVRNGSDAHPHDQRKCFYCNECGQRIDWSEVE